MDIQPTCLKRAITQLTIKVHQYNSIISIFIYLLQELLCGKMGDQYILQINIQAIKWSLFSADINNMENRHFDKELQIIINFSTSILHHSNIFPCLSDQLTIRKSEPDA